MTETICWPESETGYRRIKRKEITSYITDDLLDAVELWRRIKSYGWPQGKGYLAEPRAIFSVVALFDAEKANFAAWERERNGRNH